MQVFGMMHLVLDLKLGRICPPYQEQFLPTQVLLVNRNFSNVEVQNPTLNGSEPNIDRMFEGGNMKVTLLQVDNAFVVQSKNLYGSESSIDCSNGRVNPQPPTG